MDTQDYVIRLTPPHPIGQAVSRALQRIKTQPLSPLMEVRYTREEAEDSAALYSG
jgi:hypothetical protein